MSKRKSTTPKKPRPDFPLFPHKSGYWAKKVRGQFVYFGKVSADPQGKQALEKWVEEKDDLLAGKKPRPKGDGGLEVGELCNRFLTAKMDKLNSGEFSPRSFSDLYRACNTVISAFGQHRLIEDLDAEDFEGLRRSMARRWGPVTLGNEIRRIKNLFHYAEKNRLVEKPVLFGSEFMQPARRVMRLEREKKGKRMFEAAELRTITSKASQPIKAMILLGINAGLGNSDIANLPIKAINLKSGWLDFPRPKTGTPRRCPLWPETTEAVKESLKVRPKPKKDGCGELLFVTRTGGRWSGAGVSEPDEKGKRKMWSCDPVGHEFVKILNALGLKRAGISFYALRHTLETVGSGACDQVALDAIMGHSADDSDMSAVYRETVFDDRLHKVVNYVHNWLFGEVETK